jgi:heptosyltransferase-3
MRILLIKPKQIGDTILLTPTIAGIRQAYPEAEIWVAIREGCESILAGCPGLHRVLRLAGVDEASRTFRGTLRQAGILALLAATRFDYVFELGDGHRGRLFARAARTSRRYAVRPSDPLPGGNHRGFTAVSSYDWHSAHRVEKDYRSVAEFLPLPQEIPPLQFERGSTRTWAPAAALDEFAVLQIGTRQDYNRWMYEGWRAVCAHLLGRVGTVVITGGAHPKETAEADALKAEFGPRVLCTRGEADWPRMADLLYRARLYVGPATGAMHLAAACRCPAVVLFGRTIEDHWRPWRSPYRPVNTVDVSRFADLEEGYQAIKARTMQDIRIEDVIAGCDELLARAVPAGTS